MNDMDITPSPQTVPELDTSVQAGETPQVDTGAPVETILELDANVQVDEAPQVDADTPAETIPELVTHSLAELVPQVEAASQDETIPPVEETPSMDAPAHLEVLSPIHTIPLVETEAPDVVPPDVKTLTPDDVMPPVQKITAEPAPPKPKRRRWPTVVLALLVLLIAAYLAGVVGFMNYFMPRTTLNGTDDVSLTSIKEVAEQHAATISGFGLDVKGDGIDLTISAKDINARYDGKAFARSAMSQQNPWAWPMQLASAHNIDVETTLLYDAARLEDVVGSAVDAFNKDAKKPVDAKVSYNEKSRRYEIKPEEKGEAIDKSQVLALVRSSIGVGQNTVELGEDLLLQPSVRADDKALTEPVEKVNACLGASQDLVMGDKTLATISEEDIAKWIKVADDLSVTFDEEACTTWCRGELSEKIDTIGTSRTFKTPDGRELSISGGTYGWSLNGSEVASQIAKNVQEGTKGSIEATWLAQAQSWNPGGNEWGDTYVEIDLASQYVRYFNGGSVVWETSCVSGGPDIDKKDRRTPNGIYYINSNMRSGRVELKGEIDPKTNEPSYISYVTYWMPFIGDSVALHDADWRDSFGGDIYLTNGSHGCVNLPPDKASELYGMVGVGTVVVVHG